MSIIQDKYGFIWFATRGGVSRFDGIRFKNYIHSDEDSSSIQNGWINTVVINKENRLFFGNREGLVNFNYEKDCFDPILKKAAWEVFCDTKGRIWTRHSKYNPEIIEKGIGTDKAIGIRCYMEDDNKWIWIGTTNYGLFHYNPETSELINYVNNNKSPNTLTDNIINALYNDKKGCIWVGTPKGFNQFVPNDSIKEKGYFIQYKHDPDNKNSLPDDKVYSIHEDLNNRLWVGTVNGLAHFDRETKQFHNYVHDERFPESINDNVIRSIYCDSQGNLWIGTRMGVARLKNLKFRTYKHSLYQNSISHNKIQYVLPAPEKDVFICTPMGIDIFDRDKNHFRFVGGPKDEHSLLQEPPICMHEWDENIYHIGTYRGGVYKYDRVNNRWLNYRHINNDTTSLTNDQVFAVFKDSKNRIWIGTWGGGVNLFNASTGKFLKIKEIETDFITCFFEDKDNTFWIGSIEGLMRTIERAPGKFKSTYFPLADPEKDTKKRAVNIITQSSDGYLWVSSNKLFRLNTKTGEKRAIELKEYDISSIVSILEDEKRNLWLGTNKGLAKLSFNMSDNYHIELYPKSDGLQREYLERSACTLKDGTMVFGGSEGVSIFHPDSIKKDFVTPQIAFASLKVHNKKISIRQEVNKQIILTKSILTSDTIIINHNNNNFSIGFAAMHYRNPLLNKYAYKLKGYDINWIYTDAQQRFATYTNLDGGEYIFQLKASNSDNIWTKDPIE